MNLFSDRQLRSPERSLQWSRRGSERPQSPRGWLSRSTLFVDTARSVQHTVNWISFKAILKAFLWKFLIWKIFLGKASLPKKLDQRQFFRLISVTQSYFLQLLKTQWVPTQDLHVTLISARTLNHFHIITCQSLSPLFQLGLGVRTINILHAGSFVCPDPVPWRSYDRQQMKTTGIAFVHTDFSDILKMDHLSQTKSQALFWPKSEMRNFTRNIKNSIVSSHSWMKSSD